MSFFVDILPAMADNYIYLVGDSDLGLAMVVDPGDVEPVRRALKSRDVNLELILLTHHHKDHTAGAMALAEEFGAPILGPAKEKTLLEGLSRGVSGGEVVAFSTLRGQVLDTSGHTIGHVAYYFPQIKALFCGDALFSLGCGRLFEGTAAQMWEALKLMRGLPDDTQVYFGHEYTEANARFALAVDKTNEAILARLAEVVALRAEKKPAVPVALKVEKAANPFLRIDQPDFHKAIARSGLPLQGTDPAALFGCLRAAKDRFDSQQAPMGRK
ncbi:MAG: hydroxyacylglutathione hydrolase [Bdellovibrionales bacterium]